jgi:LysM repeat protein
MASPWIPSERPPTDERTPITGIVLIVGVPLLALILLRMLWSGSSLWFLLAGILMIGAAALIFLTRRPGGGLEYDRSFFTADQSRLPLLLAGGGLVFLAMLLVPNFSGGDGSPSGGNGSEVLEETVDPAAPAEVAEEAPINNQPEVINEAPVASEGQPPTTDTSNLPDGYQVHVVVNGDTLWGIAETYSISVEDIVSANNLANPEDLQLDQELIIPPPEASASAQQ